MRYYYFMFIFLFVFCFGRVWAHHDVGVSESFTLTFTDTSLPEGPDPTNWDASDKDKRTYTRDGAKQKQEKPFESNNCYQYKS